jgi:hypothetical protein
MRRRLGCARLSALVDIFYREVNSIDRTVASAQLNTIFHELSHLVGNTEDPVYGMVQSMVLAREDPDEAVNCAENFGFYCEDIVYSL